MSAPASPPRRVLGLDPGTRVLGWGVVEQVGRRLQAVGFGVLRADARQPVADRLLALCAGVDEVIGAHAPHAVAIEEAFHGRDASAALRIGEARGALLLTARRHDLPVTGYANNVVKKAVTGGGRAGKAQVQALVTRLLGLDQPPDPFDASDALAVALCHLQHGGRPQATAGLPPRVAEALKRAQGGPRSRAPRGPGRTTPRDPGKR